MKRCLVSAIISAVVLTAGPIVAFDWVSLTSFADARRMRVINDTLFVATSGGLLVITDPVLAGRQYTNLDGLGTVDITDIIQAADGQTWVTGRGRLIRFDGFSSVRYPIVDNDGEPFRLLCLEDDGDFLWLGSDAGLILFSKSIDGGQIQDAYQLFDDLNPAPLVYDIELTGDSIWLATSAGLAVADRTSQGALKSPANWKGYGVGNYPELGTDTIRAVAQFQDSIYVVGTVNGLFRLDRAGDTLRQLPFGASSQVWQLEVECDSLWAYTGAGLGVIVDVDSGAVAVGAPGLPSAARTGAGFGGSRWLGANTGGLYYLTDSELQQCPQMGLPHNDATDVAVTPGGQLAVLFGFGGPYLLQAGEWIARPIVVASRALAMQSDHNGRLYVGTYGGGLSRIGDTVAQFTTANSTLQEAGAPGSDYVVCYDLAVTEGYLFAVNFEPRDDTRIAIADLESMDGLDGWTSLGVGDGLNGDQMVSVDHYGNAIAVGSGLGGAFYYYLGDDPFDKADDSLAHYSQNHSDFRCRIISDVVRVVRFSPEGELWVGTNYGISRFDPGLESFVEVNLPAGFGPDITALEFDSRGNVWIGAKNGLARIDALSGQTTLFTTANSGLISDHVANLTFDNLSGNLYVATGSGLSVILSTIGRPTEDLDSVYAFPNPFVVDSPDDQLNFNFAGQATLRIFTVAGELVAELPDPVWDGRSPTGEPVASGVYLYVLTDGEGHTGRGKFLLVRN